MRRKLDTFNPMNMQVDTHSFKKEFLSEIQEKLEATKELLDNLQKLHDDNSQINENISTVCLPLNEVAEREVPKEELD